MMEFINTSEHFFIFTHHKQVYQNEKKYSKHSYTNLKQVYITIILQKF
jgi:hypothetical protein